LHDDKRASEPVAFASNQIHNASRQFVALPPWKSDENNAAGSMTRREHEKTDARCSHYLFVRKCVRRIGDRSANIILRQTVRSASFSWWALSITW